MDEKDIAERAYINGYTEGYNKGKQDIARAIIRELECTPISLIDGNIMNLYKKYGVVEKEITEGKV